MGGCGGHDYGDLGDGQFWNLSGNGERCGGRGGDDPDTDLDPRNFVFGVLDSFTGAAAGEGDVGRIKGGLSIFECSPISSY